ncbi:hypothetical protein [Bradyrhizobium sp. CER78]|uniref:hypothetical protein n=1 Tax=Bradyrhizobium sp. CER78 TaxID=3039162 RepID=UPI0024482C72|nr:hypothetical protein [Bradyrhizobium sp. CER78]MDH2382327.1 hypothetical protein [Bradyrhizobium sp. CER78]
MKRIFSLTLFATGALGFAMFLAALRPEPIGRPTRVASAFTRFLISIEANNAPGESHDHEHN